MKLLTFALMLLILTACGKQANAHAPGGPFYFETFADDYAVPITPKREILRSEAEEREKNGRPYCIAYFNDQGLVLSFEKRLKGKTFFRVDYGYTDGRVSEARGVDADGKKTVLSY